MTHTTTDAAEARELIRDWRELVRLENVKAREPDMTRDAIDIFQSDMYIRWPAGRVDALLSRLATAEAASGARTETALRQKFRDASRGYGRAGTAEMPDGPYMSMDDAAEVYARLVTTGRAS